jgi:hypothetical protein
MTEGTRTIPLVVSGTLEPLKNGETEVGPGGVIVVHHRATARD